MGDELKEIRNGIEINKRKAEKMKRRIVYDEIINQRLKQFSDGDMVTKHIKTIKEILHAYSED